jgi:murein DD-endopeptidase MepM/ murein hydrolase activator NlpD
MRPRIALFLVLVLVPVVLWAGLPLVSSGQSAKESRLQQRIDTKRKKVEHLKATEGVLTNVIQQASSKIDTLQQRQDTIQADLDRKKAELLRLQDDLRRTRAELAKLRAKLSRSRVVLSRRLLEIYQAGQPDLMTVVLNSKGFADLLERSEFMRRIKDQDAQVITAVRKARALAAAVAQRLAALEGRQQRITTAVLEQRNRVAGVKLDLAAARAQKQARLQSVQGLRHETEKELAAMEREQSRIRGALQGSAGPIKRGTGRFIWPVNGTFTSPFGMRWGRLHAGIDLAAPTGTPIRAADGGTVQIASWYGGYGNYTCIGHGGGISTCYGHQSSIGVSVGQNVSQGEVIGAVGSTGHSTGPHLHFEVRINGNPVDPMGYL